MTRDKQADEVFGYIDPASGRARWIECSHPGRPCPRIQAYKQPYDEPETRPVQVIVGALAVTAVLVCFVLLLSIGIEYPVR